MDPRSDVDVQLGIAKCDDTPARFPALVGISEQFGERPGPLMASSRGPSWFSPGEPESRPKSNRERILDLLANGQQVPVSFIARELGLAKDRASKITTEMMFDGWVSKDKRLGKGRVVFVTLTP